MSNPGSPTSPIRVIVADDHDLVRREIVRLVAETLPGAVITEAADGQEALRAFRRGGADLLVSDQRMPRMTGTTLTRRLRQGGAALPIVIVSLDPEAEPGAHAAGASWFVPKEVLAEALPTVLRRWAAGLEQAPPGGAASVPRDPSTGPGGSASYDHRSVRPGIPG